MTSDWLLICNEKGNEEASWALSHTQIISLLKPIIESLIKVRGFLADSARSLILGFLLGWKGDGCYPPSLPFRLELQ